MFPRLRRQSWILFVSATSPCGEVNDWAERLERMVGWLVPAEFARIGGLAFRSVQWRQVPYIGALAAVAVFVSWKLSHNFNGNEGEEKPDVQSTNDLEVHDADEKVDFAMQPGIPDPESELSTPRSTEGILNPGDLPYCGAPFLDDNRARHVSFPENSGVANGIIPGNETEILPSDVRHGAGTLNEGVEDKFKYVTKDLLHSSGSDNLKPEIRQVDTSIVSIEAEPPGAVVSPYDTPRPNPEALDSYDAGGNLQEREVVQDVEDLREAPDVGDTQVDKNVDTINKSDRDAKNVMSEDDAGGNLQGREVVQDIEDLREAPEVGDTQVDKKVDTINKSDTDAKKVMSEDDAGGNLQGKEIVQDVKDFREAPEAGDTQVDKNVDTAKKSDTDAKNVMSEDITIFSFKTSKSNWIFPKNDIHLLAGRKRKAPEKSTLPITNAVKNFEDEIIPVQEGYKADEDGECHTPLGVSAVIQADPTDSPISSPGSVHWKPPVVDISTEGMKQSLSSREQSHDENSSFFPSEQGTVKVDIRNIRTTLSAKPTSNDAAESSGSRNPDCSANASHDSTYDLHQNSDDEHSVQSPSPVKLVLVERKGTEGEGSHLARREYAERLRSYDEYLADPELSPTMRSQVLRARASVAMYFDDSDDNQ